MKNLKKFNVKSYLKHLSKSVEKLSEEDAYILAQGTYLLWKNLTDYYKDYHGSAKRLDDLTEYLYIIQCAYIKKNKGSK